MLRLLYAIFFFCAVIAENTFCQTKPINVVIAKIKFEGANEYCASAHSLNGKILKQLNHFSNVKIIDRELLSQFDREINTVKSDSSQNTSIIDPVIPADFMVKGDIFVSYKRSSLGTKYFEYSLNASCVDMKTSEVATSSNQGEFDSDMDEAVNPLMMAIEAFSYSVSNLVIKNAPVLESELSGYINDLLESKKEIKRRIRRSILLYSFVGVGCAGGATGLLFLEKKNWLAWTGIVIGYAAPLGSIIYVCSISKATRKSTLQIDAIINNVKSLYNQKYGHVFQE